MVYNIEGIGTYSNSYSADFAAKTHARAANKSVLMYVYEDDDKHNFVAVRYYYPSGKVTT